jgi:alkanesulfonate monooxygenase SsuD/methylene tetrahydromethanopterin reductase-like flavin-dependent oxidoreductase (luciferase family)
MRHVAAAIRAQVETGVAPSGYRSALPQRRLHLTIAASGPRMVEVAAEVGDRMVINLVTLAQAVTLAARVAIPTVCWAVAALEPGRATHAEVAGQIAHYLAAPGYSDMFREAGFGDLVDRAVEKQPVTELARLVPEELLSAVAIYGSKSDVVDSWTRFKSAGIDVALVPATAEDPAGTKILEVLARGM